MTAVCRDDAYVARTEPHHAYGTHVYDIGTCCPCLLRPYLRYQRSEVWPPPDSSSLALNLGEPLIFASRWVYFFTATMMFIYQTLDAVDGKQARRTNNSTPLGQLFDHGCDAFTVLLCADGMTSLTKSPDRALMNAAVFFVPFFLAQWEEMHTGM